MTDKDSKPEGAEQASKTPSDKGCGCSKSAHMLPKVTFSTFILSLSSSGMVHLGEVPEPESGQTMENLPLAKHTIDILAMLKDKTEKCLDKDESRLLDGILYELRLKYVMKTQ